ncbi:hypothetical protein AAG747_21015 [Rapidithrix thailandica]|uniref:Uncharacterized protein n=1 Tax=Rapidithrix thailandica TaxID=413964 RepID=A0AAW9SGM5_9BACT
MMESMVSFSTSFCNSLRPRTAGSQPQAGELALGHRQYELSNHLGADA